jgi:hypothetical protein
VSRSYRKPYCAVTGADSAADDKRVARRGVRRTQNQALREFVAHDDDWDEFIMPVRYECPWNNTYSWGRDGKQRLQYEPVLDYNWHWSFMTAEEAYERDWNWYRKLCRK